MAAADNYEVLARKYRPQSFDQVLGQDAIVATLLNAIRLKRTAHAYLFSGARGTGKTTLARLFAKALNCLDPKASGEPCGQCSACREIGHGNSLDVIEIDGASNRGIDDIRQINETVGYVASGGKYKIYIIDEVHMLTKEAFNALLKTLEEPPANVKFFFATTEPHKVLATILSRCQHFQLRRIPNDLIVQKLQYEAKDLELNIPEEAFRLIAKAADGGMRDAESLFDQVLAFTGNEVTVESVAEILGVMPSDRYFRIDSAASKQDFSEAFAIAREVFDMGKDVGHFLSGLVEHYRNVLVVQLGGAEHGNLSVSANDRQRYEEVAKSYSRVQCLDILDGLLESQLSLRQAPCKQIALEAILLRLIRSQRRVPVDAIVQRLMQLESKLGQQAPAEPVQEAPKKQETPLPVPTQAKPAQEAPVQMTQAQLPVAELSISEDPTPRPEEIPPPRKKKEPVTQAPAPTPAKAAAKPAAPQAAAPAKPAAPPALSPKEQSRIDTLVQFAATELEGAVERK